ncbi:MAG: hypothetical protein MR890_06605 [Akkermansia muciniphila]|nr:hypothetical protein [Akkermansia muciniphila]
MSSEPSLPASPRLVSIDALRGLDMALLAGGAPLLLLLLQACFGDSLPPEVAAQFRHAEWGAGFTCWDLVMPLFIFVVGVSMPFAFAGYRRRGGAQWRRRTLLRVLRRVLCLFLLGMVVQGNLLAFDADHISLFCNTLQAIAAGYLIAAGFLMFGGARSCLVACVLSQVGYWAAMRFVPYAGHEGGRFLPHDNLAYFIDCTLQGSWQDGTPYTWILTSAAFGALTLMGVLGGQAMQHLRGLRACLILGLGGAGCLLAAYFLQADTPLIKHIFSATMVLYSGGWCLLLLALFHLLFDLLPRTHFLAAPFLPFGSNAILAYLLTATPGLRGSFWNSLCLPLFSGFSRLFGDFQPLVFSALSFLSLFALLSFLRSKSLFLRV